MTGDAELEMSPAHAAVALARVDQSAAAVRRHAGWTVRILGAYAVATVVYFPVAGMLHGSGAVLAGAVWTGFVLGVVGYVRSQRVVGRRFRRLYLIAAVAWTALWIPATLLGRFAFPDRPAYWVPAGLIVAIPMLAAAVVADRRGRPDGRRNGS